MIGFALLAAIPAALAVEQQLSWMPSHFDEQPIQVQEGDIQNEEFWTQQARHHGRDLCFIRAGSEGEDDAVAITKALNEDCSSRSLVVFPDNQYNIKTTMTTLDMSDVWVSQFGRFLWSPDVDYWLTVSMPIGWQNQSTVWYLGGDNVLWDGYGHGTMDGNGQVWYDWAQGGSNLPHRPMNINYRWFTNSVVRNLRYRQSQMWTMAISYGQNLLMEDIDVSNTANNGASLLNTDGADTIWSDNIMFRRWKVDNGDDSIALKDNSTNIYIYDCEFWNGQGIAIGSIGQFKGNFTYIENLHAKNITGHNTHYAAYAKTWPGIQYGYPPNGGGGGLGYARNILIEDVRLDAARGQPIYMEQCENYQGEQGQHCDSSEFKLEDFVWRGIIGTTVAGNEYAGVFLCSAAAGGCSNVTVEDFDVRAEGEDEVLGVWHCESVNGEDGFTCTDGSTRP